MQNTEKAVTPYESQPSPFGTVHFRTITVSLDSIDYSALPLMNSSIPFEAAFPAPIARITVAAPVTASPPA